jgi:hypothetical protein
VFSIDIVTDRLFRNRQVMSSGDCPDDRLTCEYRAMLADFAEHVAAGRSCAGIEELRLVATAERLGRMRC